MNELEKKILWQCRRGLWELDAIFIPFVENNFAELSNEEIDSFRELLSFEDIDIFDISVSPTYGLFTFLLKILIGF